LRRAEAWNGSERERSHIPLQAISSELQDPAAGGVPEHGITQEWLWQDTEEGFA